MLAWELFQCCGAISPHVHPEWDGGGGVGGQDHEPRCFRSRNSYILTPERSSGAPRLPRQPSWERVPGAGSGGNACALGSAPLADWRHALGAPPSPSSPPFGRSGRAFRSPEPLQEAGKRRVAELQGERLRALAGTGVKARGAPAPPGEGASPGTPDLGAPAAHLGSFGLSERLPPGEATRAAADLREAWSAGSGSPSLVRSKFPTVQGARQARG